MNVFILRQYRTPYQLYTRTRECGVRTCRENKLTSNRWITQPMGTPYINLLQASSVASVQLMDLPSVPELYPEKLLLMAHPSFD